MREKPVHFEITDCAQGTTLGLSLLPNCPRLSHISLRGLLPRRLLGEAQVSPLLGDIGAGAKAHADSNCRCELKIPCTRWAYSRFSIPGFLPGTFENACWRGVRSIEEGG
jgi:hypothetical protein